MNPPKRIKKKIRRYMTTLSASGMEDREVARAGYYANHYGLDKMTSGGPHCVVFTKPTCENWNCLNPQHQNLDIQETP